MVLKSIGVMSAAKVVGVLYAVMGLLMGLVFGAIFAMIPSAMAADGGEVPGWLAPMFGLGAIVFMPVLYGICGFIGGAIAAAIYNALAGIIGGLELRLEPPKPA
jgi:nitrate/nitrite transporter NarK